MTNLGNYLHGQYVPECGCFSTEEAETAFIMIHTECGKSLPVLISDLGLDISAYVCAGEELRAVSQRIDALPLPVAEAQKSAVTIEVAAIEAFVLERSLVLSSGRLLKLSEVKESLSTKKEAVKISIKK